MRVSKLFALMTIGLFATAAQSAGAQTPVRIGVAFDSSTRADSANLRSAFKSGIEDGGGLRVIDGNVGARYMVNASFASRGGKVFVDMRVVDVVTSNVVARSTTSAPPADIAGAVATLARGAATKVVR